jgi:hypothetical protein
VSVLPPVHFLRYSTHGDIRHYQGYVRETLEGKVPYRDFRLEYPPGALPIFLAAAPADHGFFTRFRVLMWSLGAVAIALVAAGLALLGASRARLYLSILLLATLPLTLTADLVFQRYDLWPAVLVLLATVALLAGSTTVAFASLGLGAAAKIYPIALLPLALSYHRCRPSATRDLAAFAAGPILLGAAFAIVAFRGLGSVGWTLIRRPLHSESLGGSLLLVSHQLGVYRPHVYLSFAGSWDLSGALPAFVAVLQSIFLAAALLLVWLLFQRSPRREHELLAAIAAVVVGLVTFGKVLSPQYLVWVAVVAPFASRRAWVVALALAAPAFLLTYWYYTRLYGDLIDLGRASWIVFGRNLLLVGLFAVLVLSLRPARTHEPARGVWGMVALEAATGRAAGKPNRRQHQRGRRR